MAAAVTKVTMDRRGEIPIVPEVSSVPESTSKATRSTSARLTRNTHNLASSILSGRRSYMRHLHVLRILHQKMPVDVVKDMKAADWIRRGHARGTVNDFAACDLFGRKIKDC